MEKFLKYFKYLCIFICLGLSIIFLFLMYHLSWSVKYSVGDCLLNDETVYLYDSSGPLLKGSYGLKLLLPKNQRSQYGVAFSRDNVESEEFQKVECPKDKLTSEDIEHIRNILNSN